MDARVEAMEPMNPPVLMPIQPEQRSCQMAWWVHKEAAMCTCKVCVSERLFLRILALLVA